MEVPAMVALDAKAKYLASLELKISDAIHGVRFAEEELEVAVNRLAPVCIGDKRLITKGLECSFEKLRTARQYVVELRQLLAPK